MTRWCSSATRSSACASYLRRFLFTDDRVNDRVDQLSGGERARLMLAKVLKRGGNVIVLDEPTNDLDLPSLRMLEEALADFDGSVLVVSHDRYFLDRICDQIDRLRGRGRVRAARQLFLLPGEEEGARCPGEEWLEQQHCGGETRGAKNVSGQAAKAQLQGGAGT